jgi:hypothetical protein
VPSPVKILITDLTTGAIDGAGVFDKIMTSLVAHLKVEYTANRIAGAEYTKAYVGIVGVALQTAQQFLVASDQAYWSDLTAEAQIANLVLQGEGLEITNTDILPQQHLLLQEQTEVQRAQTMNTRTDGVTAVVGSIGKQKDLYTQQIASYQRDAEMKVAKLYSDAWITQKTIDEGLVAPAQFVNTEVNEVMLAIRAANNLGS